MAKWVLADDKGKKTLVNMDDVALIGHIPVESGKEPSTGSRVFFRDGTILDFDTSIDEWASQVIETDRVSSGDEK